LLQVSDGGCALVAVAADDEHAFTSLVHDDHLVRLRERSSERRGIGVP
jgi:hypothetical protein